MGGSWVCRRAHAITNPVERRAQFEVLSNPHLAFLSPNMSAPTSAQITSLYQSTLKASKQFASYNFRNCTSSALVPFRFAPPPLSLAVWLDGRAAWLSG